MVESLRGGVDLRLTVPSEGPLRDLAAELATRFAEYAGADKRVAAALGEAVDRLAERLASNAQPIEFEMARQQSQITVRASVGLRRDETSCPIPD